MSRLTTLLHAFNRGIVSPQSLGRTDLERLRLSAETMTNWVPRTLGSMMLRPGTVYIGSTNSNAAARLIPFVYATTDTAIIELTDSLMRVWVSESPITRVSVSATVTNGDFSSGTGWTVTTSADATGTISGGKLTLACPSRGGLVTVHRSVSIGGGDTAKEHAFRIVVDRGPVVFRCGSTAGDDDIITQTTLGTGTHSLAFTPNTATVYPQFESRKARSIIVDAITIEAAGTFTMATPWPLASLDSVRVDQSGDTLYRGDETAQLRWGDSRA